MSFPKWYFLGYVMPRKANYPLTLNFKSSKDFWRQQTSVNTWTGRKDITTDESRKRDLMGRVFWFLCSQLSSNENLGLLEVIWESQKLTACVRLYPSFQGWLYKDQTCADFITVLLSLKSDSEISDLFTTFKVVLDYIHQYSLCNVCSLSEEIRLWNETLHCKWTMTGAQI